MRRLLPVFGFLYFLSACSPSEETRAFVGDPDAQAGDAYVPPLDGSVGDGSADAVTDDGHPGADADEPETPSAAHCTNGTMDSTETDVDCGGACPACGVGKQCAVDSDCETSKCNASKVCAPAACGDGVKNGAETDVDCGGPSCPKCADGKKCGDASHCSSGVCTGGTCMTASCVDGVKNGSETDIDCGGGCARKCGIGMRCNGAGDCTSATCVFESGVNRCLCPDGMTRINVPGGAGTYCMDRAEVTNEQYAKLFVATGPDPAAQEAKCAWNTSFVPTNGWPAPVERFGHPVRYVDWCDALAYCKAQGKVLCGKIGGGAVDYAKHADIAESKWFNACSQGVNAYPYGDYDSTKCNGADYVTDGGAPGDYRVLANGATTSFPAGSFANTACIGGPLSDIYQLSGNVAEWEDACQASAGASDLCLARGGSYLSDASALRCDAKRELRRDAHEADVGFRCCL